MDKKPCGYCLIINMIGDRKGTEKDACDLRKLFEKLEFVVGEYKNLTPEEINELMENIESLHPSDGRSKMCCFVMFILAHGGTYSGQEDEKGDECKIGSAFFKTTEKKKIPLSKIKKSIENAPALYGKPKLLFVQTCRGDIGDPGVKIKEDGKERIPSCSDFLLSFAASEGFPSFRHEENGTYFIQNIFEIFDNDQNIDRYDVVSLMTKVTGKVAKETYNNKFQNPETTSTFRKFLYFRKPPGWLI